MFNAKQLVTWLLHFVSSNYMALENRKEFQSLKPEHLEHCKEHRWPPLSYLNEVEEYEKKLKAQGRSTDSGCVVM